MQELREATSLLMNMVTGGCPSRELLGGHRPRERWSVMSYGRRRGLRPVSPYVIVLALAVVLTASFFLPTRAEAAVSDHTVPFPNHTVPTISPSGTTINLFDYWVNPDNHLSVSGNGGINASHRFQFNDGQGRESLNRWTGNTDPQPGIVSNTLSDGYPQLSGTYGGDSLRYLFDSSAQTGKTSHFGVTGLLKVQDGYYVYDSSENYAAYNADKNAFDVYDTWGIDKVGDSSHRGQFFPFDAADKVFKEESGRLVQNGITADNAGNHVNHHFGLSMSTRFVQPNGGLTNDKKDMTFEFAGDDDVWVFIDDVLVGDIGGIHSRASLSINFHTGNIKVNDKSDGTLLSKYQAAKKGTSGFDGNTFKDGTNHTLKFFYLERGATDSNMELKFNLVTVPESDIIKFDQDGGLVEGAQFALYKTDESFADTTANPNNLLGSGTTNANGQLTLTNKADNGVINFDDLYKEYHYKYYLLKETKAPNGYRSSLTATDGSMQLEYVPASDKNDAGGVIINRGGMDAGSVVWKTGAFAAAKETITAPPTVYKADNDLTKSNETVNLDSGILFAVVLKRDKSADTGIKDQNNWYAVSGDPSTGMGYTLAEKPSKAGAIEAAKKDLHAFTLNTSGQYQVEIQNLPGDISKYHYLLSGNDRKDAEYTVAIYHTTASSIANANTDNTVHVFSDDLPSGEKNFQRQFATRLLVTNIQNRLFVQKTDTEGNPVDGAKFALYTSSQVTTENGKVMLNVEQTPYDTLTTGSVDYPVLLEGAGIFPNTSNGNRPLVKGTYFLKEVSAPEGFLLNDTLTKVIVDDYGVHADAGTDDDGVSTFVGPGALMKNLGQFGAEGDIDNTLTWIKGQRQTSDGKLDGNDNLSWNNDAKGGEDEVHLKYGANGRVYQYGPTEEGKPYRLETETGWIRMGIMQDERPKGTTSKGARANLGDMNLNALFTGATCVRVANEREASLEVTKKVVVPNGLTGNKDAKFTFKFTVPDGKTYKAAVFKNAGAASEKQVGDMFDLTNGREQTITAGQTIRVYGLAEHDAYTVRELTGTDKMPAGFTLTKREQGGNAPSGEGDSISGTIAKQIADGTLADANKLVFTNTYSVKSPVTLTNAFWAQKVLQGRDWKDGDSFKIYLRADKGTSMPDGAENAPVSGMKQVVKTVENGDKFDFGEIEYTKPGTYTYLIAEATPSQNDASWLPGFGYSSASYRVTVTVSDNGDGTLSQPAVKMEQTYTDDGVSHEDNPIKVADKIAKITNTYRPKETSVTLKAKKRFTGGELAGNDFTFQLLDNDGKELQAVQNDKDGKVAFAAIDYATPGDHDYAIKEVAGNDSTIVYDAKDVKVHVKVTDEKGELKAVATYDGEKAVPTFTNSKPTADATIEATKTLRGKDLTAGAFTFGLYDQAGNEVARGTNDQGGKVKLTVKGLNLGEYDYTLKEEKAGQTVDGVVYDTKEVKVHVKVEQNQDDNNKTKVTVTYDGAATAPTFTNTYEARATDSGAIALTKSVNVHDGSYQLKAGDFAFELVGSDGSVIQTRKNDADGNVAFDKLIFDHAGTFTYTVREVQPTDDAPGVPGVTYTGKTYTLTYVVKDNNDGKLVVESSTVKPSEGTENGVTPNTMTFANSYQPGQTSYQISGTKVLENADPATTRTPADGEFTFALIDVATGQEIDRTTNVGKAFTFKAISYTATGSHAYQVKEVAGQDGTITYSDAVLDVTVNVTDDGSGQLTATANKTAADLTFTNTYTPTATTATITGTKALTGRDLAEGEFFFDLKDADGNVVQTVQNGADGTFGFAPLQLDKVGTYVYTVSERAGATANGVTYDTTVFTATVTVTENAETHALEAQVAYSKGGKAADAVAFSNSYAPAATEVKLGASKVLSGEDLKEGQFSFQLKDADGKVLQTAKNAADGTVGFEAISYDKPGTYAYSISEVDDGQKNVTYDAAEHRVTVTVTDDGAGHLVATVTYDGAVAPVFKNTYTPPTTPPTEPPTNPPSKSPVPKEEKPGLPYTGDTSLSPMALGGIAGGAVVLIAAGVILRRRNR